MISLEFCETFKSIYTTPLMAAFAKSLLIAFTFIEDGIYPADFQLEWWIQGFILVTEVNVYSCFYFAKYF